MHGRPAVQLLGVAEYQRQHDEPGAEGDRRLEQLDEEVHPILQLVHQADPEVQPRHANRPQRFHQFPTDEKRRMARFHISATANEPAAIHNACAPSPPTSCDVGSRPTSDSIG